MCWIVALFLVCVLNSTVDDALVADYNCLGECLLYLSLSNIRRMSNFSHQHSPDVFYEQVIASTCEFYA